MTARPTPWIGPNAPDFAGAVAGLSASAWQPARVPAAVVPASGPQDVVAAVRAAAEQQVGVAVRSGGHSLSATHLAENAVTVDLRRLDRIEVDRASATAWVEPGITVADAARALDRAGMSFPIGHAPTVGLGGYLLAGGNGWNTSQWGHGCERVLAAEVVLPDGERQLVDHDHRLFPALRGAGPLFPGVVLRFRLQLVRGAVPVQRAFATVFGDDPEGLGRRLDELCRELPAQVETTVFWRPATLGRPQPEATVAVTCFGSPLPVLPLLERHGFPASALPATTMAALVAGLPRHEGDALASDHVWSDAGYAQVLPRLPQRADVLTDRSSILLTTDSRRADGGLPPDSCFVPTGSMSIAPYAHWDPRAQPARAQIEWTHQVTSDLADLGTGHYVGEADLTNGSDAVGRCFPPSVRTVLDELLAQHDPAQRMVLTADAHRQLDMMR